MRVAAPCSRLAVAPLVATIIVVVVPVVVVVEMKNDMIDGVRGSNDGIDIDSGSGRRKYMYRTDIFGKGERLCTVQG